MINCCNCWEVAKSHLSRHKTTETIMTGPDTKCDSIRFVSSDHCGPLKRPKNVLQDKALGFYVCLHVLAKDHCCAAVVKSN